MLTGTARRSVGPRPAANTLGPSLRYELSAVDQVVRNGCGVLPPSVAKYGSVACIRVLITSTGKLHPSVHDHTRK